MLEIKFMKRLSFFLFLLLSSLAVCAQETTEIKAKSGNTYVQKQGSYTPSFKIDGSTKKVRNVILLIGDGMGHGALNAAMYANGGKLTMTNLKTMGYVQTQSANNFTTDSAASGTAYASGEKTNNGYLGLSPDLEILENIPEKLDPLGFACGVVTTDNIHGGTPASFYAHQRARRDYPEIWKDLANSSLSYASGASKSVYESQPLTTQETITSTFDLVFSLDSVDINKSDRVLYLLESNKLDERGDYLKHSTEVAIEFLSQKCDKGFFLMVEGARIDNEAHSNNTAGMIREVLDFDKAVEAAIRFAEEDGHTLVIISADHETGAVTLGHCNPEDGFATAVFASGGHSPAMVPLFAYGPHSRDFAGCQENSDVSRKILNLLLGK